MKHFFCLLIYLSWLQSGYTQGTPLQASWDDGLRFISRDSALNVSVGGRVHYDIAFSHQSKGLDSFYKNAGSKVEVRRARLSFEGEIKNTFAYEFEFTFREQLEFADMYIAFLKFPYVDRLTVGYFREPFGLEELSSSNRIVFMERSLTSAFAPGRNTGLMIQKQWVPQKLHSYAGLFRRTDDLGADLEGIGHHSFTTRWVYTPVMTPANEVMHLGLAFNRFTPNDSTYKIGTENEVHTNPKYLATGNIIGARTVNQFGGEAGWLKGPLCFQAEWIESFVQFYTNAAISNRLQRSKSFYLNASMFLGGGRRRYSTNSNRFASIRMDRDSETGRMKSAWEAGLRVSHLDLSNATTPANKATNVTAGVNWYFNTSSRVMMNYVHSFFNNGLWANTVQLRMQVGF